VTQTLFRGGPLLDPERPEPHEGALLASEGRIAAVLGPGEPAPGDARVVDLAGQALAPGFLDVHHHGATIFDALDAPAASLRQDAASMLRHGVTAFLPTTVALTQAELRHRVSGLAAAAAELREPRDAAAVLGIHLEGPWISPEAPGAQPRDAIRPYDAAEGREVLDAGEGLVRMVTLAAETPGAGELIAELGRRGVVASLGHTKASAEVASEGFDRGIRHVTHLFNAMGVFHHREPGAIGAALADDRATCDLICDGVHVHPAAVRAAARAKGEGLLLITDAIDPAEGGELGGGLLEADGPVWRLPGGTLAGSRLALCEAIENARAFGAMTRLAAVAAATLGPARLLGVEAERGTLRPGARADLVVLGDDGSVRETWLGAERVHAAP
jgi:N-acetylglucosamine-6-phosphate deacetylase